MNPNEIGTREASRILGVSQGYVMKLVRNGQIEARKWEGTWLLDSQSVMEYKMCKKPAGQTA